MRQALENGVIHELKAYQLPFNVLPFAPDRYPFRRYSRQTIVAAAQLARRFPEKKGALTNAFRQLSGEVVEGIGSPSIIIEAHIDGRAIPRSLDSRLLSLGFEPDGFVKYVPEVYDFHRTLEFRVPVSDVQRARELRKFAELTCVDAFRCLNGVVESYIELEVYPSINQVVWTEKDLSAAACLDKSIERENFEWIPSIERQSQGWAGTIVKRADIHIKLARCIEAHARAELLSKFHLIGFHHVITWAGNDICTAEFARAKDARRIFALLIEFFNRHGGAVAVTFERVAKLWRTTYLTGNNFHVSRLPPIVVCLGT